MDASPEPSIERWSEVLRQNWEALARTRFRNYFIASHRGWDVDAAWQAQARYDAEVVLHEIRPAMLAAADVLEIGCGVGRLAQVVAPRARSYTGIDIAPSMVAEARARCGAQSNARFLVGNGSGVPAAARDRGYGLAFALAVFVHCPPAVIGAVVADVCKLLAPGCEFRFQLRADRNDPTGIAPLSEAPLTAAPPDLDSVPLAPTFAQDLEEVDALLAGRYYMGHAFGYEEAARFLATVAPHAHARVMRFDREHIYVDLRVP